MHIPAATVNDGGPSVFKTSWRIPDVYYARTDEEANRYLSDFDSSFIAFEVNGTPSESTVEAADVIQLALPDKVIIIHLKQIDRVPQKLLNILSNPDITKVSVDAEADATKLHRVWGVSLMRCVDIVTLAQSQESNQWPRLLDTPRPTALNQLMDVYLGEALPPSVSPQGFLWTKWLGESTIICQLLRNIYSLVC
jgi:hypothetical protein